MTVVLVFAVVLLLAVLLSALADRSVLSTAVVFLVAGFLLGPGVWGVLPVDAGNQTISRFAELALFSILFIWQMPHFLAIAILYKDDYAAGGYKMLPNVDRDDLAITAGQIILYNVAMIPVSLAPALIGMAGQAYAAVRATDGEKLRA